MVNAKGVIAGMAGAGVVLLAWLGPSDGSGSATCSPGVSAAHATSSSTQCEQVSDPPVTDGGTDPASTPDPVASSTTPDVVREPSVTGSTSTATPGSSSTEEAGDADGHGVDPNSVSSVPSPKPFDAGEAQQWAAAQRTATAFIKAWVARPGDTRDVWFARVSPYLTPEGRGTYAGVWPIKGVWSKVTGPAVVRPWADAEMANLDLPVAVPTDVGTVMVHIDATGSQGLVTSFDLPEQG